MNGEKRFERAKRKTVQLRTVLEPLDRSSLRFELRMTIKMDRESHCYLSPTRVSNPRSFCGKSTLYTWQRVDQLHPPDTGCNPNSKVVCRLVKQRVLHLTETPAANGERVHLTKASQNGTKLPPNGGRRGSRPAGIRDADADRRGDSGRAAVGQD